MATISDDDRSWAIYANAAGLLVFTNVPYANLIATLLIWLRVKRSDEMPFARTHAAAAFNFQATYSLVVTLGSLAMLGLFLGHRDTFEASALDRAWLLRGLALYAVLTLANVVLSIIGAIAASDLRAPRYFAAIPFVAASR